MCFDDSAWHMYVPCFCFISGLILGSTSCSLQAGEIFVHDKFVRCGFLKSHRDEIFIFETFNLTKMRNKRMSVMWLGYILSY